MKSADIIRIRLNMARVHISENKEAIEKLEKQLKNGPQKRAVLHRV